MDGGGRARHGPAPRVVTGPLAGYESALRAELTRVGYAPASVRDIVAAMVRLSGWMRRRGMVAADLGPAAVREFLAMRRKATRLEQVARRGLGPLLRFLRGRGVIPAAEVTCRSPVAALLADYQAWLVGERGLAAASVRCYLLQGGKFLADLPDPIDAALDGLDAAAVVSFVMRQARGCGTVWSAKTLVTATRSLLRFLHVQGLVPVALAGAVPNVAGWRLASLPRALPVGQVQAVLAAPDASTAAGLRDRAVLTVLARLGLRGAEAAALGLDDVDWRSGEIVVRGKGSRVERVPLPVDVGQVLAAYVTGGRPACSCRSLFVTARAPYQPLSSTSVRAIMGRACRRAGLPRLGPHRLRHTVATELLRAGAPLTEVGQLLRHRSQLSTAIYAKVDFAALRLVARPWPATAPGGAA